MKYFLFCLKNGVFEARANDYVPGEYKRWGIAAYTTGMRRTDERGRLGNRAVLSFDPSNSGDRAEYSPGQRAAAASLLAMGLFLVRTKQDPDIR